MATATILVRCARIDELPRVREAYDAWGYRASIAPEDIVFVAEQGDAMLGLVRRTQEYGTLMLRGMYVAPIARRNGIGSLLLSHFVDTLPPDAACWCIPYENLRHFYARGGFGTVAVDDAPAFLRQRVEWYRSEGLDVALMRRG